MWIHKRIQLSAKTRGFHLVTRAIVNELPEIKQIGTGLMHVFIQHTSASLAINENADPDVREDMESYFSKTVPENEPYYRHTMEGSDDMPAHIKAVLLGSELTVPVSEGKLAMGLWQGIYLCEHRENAGPRTIIATLHGE